MVRRLAAIVVVAAALPAAQAPAPPKGAEVPDGILRLMSDRGQAWMTRDRALLVRGLASEELAARELRAFDNAAALNFATFRYRPLTLFSGNLASARVRARYPGRQVAAYQFTEESAVAGVEAVPYLEDVFATFVRDRPDPADPYEGWRLASTADFEPLGAFSARHPWDFGPVVAASSEHFAAWAHPDHADRLRGILGVAEEAYRVVRAFWPRPADGRYVIVLPSSAEELRDLLQLTVDLEKFVAFAAATVSRQDGWEPAGVRIYIQLSHFDRYSPAGRRVVLAHELIHAVTRPASGPFMPTWVEEGLATYGSEPGRARVRPRGSFPADDEFFVGSTEDIVRVYRLAQSAFEVLDAAKGREGVARFYEALGSARVAPGTKDYHLARALQESVSWTVEDWLRAWQRRGG